jgi:Lon protease-like protein
LFLSDRPHFPNAPLQLHIFEPKYRVMISRALATSSRNFIVVCVNEQRAAALPEQPPRPEPVAPADAAAAVADDGEERKEAAPDVRAVAAPEHPALQRTQPMGAAHILDPLRFHPPPFDPLRAGGPGGGGGVELAVRAGHAVHDGDVACLLKIVHVRAHADGRSFVECVGVSRVRLADVRVEDEEAFGLLSAEAVVIEDEPEEEEPPPQQQQQQQPQAAADVEDDEAKEVDGLRNRRAGREVAAGSDGAAASDASVAASSSAATASSLPSLPLFSPPPADAAAEAAAASVAARSSVSELVSECRSLLQTYCSVTGFTVGRLGLIHGRACPPDEPARADEFVWWLCRVLPDDVDLALKHECLASTSLRHRLNLCIDMLHASIRDAQHRTKWQSRGAAIIAVLVIIYLLARHNQWA